MMAGGHACFRLDPGERMSLVNDIHAVIDVGSSPAWVGTQSPLTLTISGGGADLFSGTWTGANLLGNGESTVPPDRTGAARVPLDTEGRRQSAAQGGLVERMDLWDRRNYGIWPDEDPYDVTDAA
jgi:hypothetical protein